MIAGQGQPETELRIIGMTCGGCVGRVERALRDVRGVRGVSVNLMTESAVVSFDENRAPLAALTSAVRETGYDAEPMPVGGAQGPQSEDDPRLRETLRRHRQAMVQAVGLSLPIVGLELLRGVLWGPGPAAQIPCRVLQIVLLIMLALSPGGGPILAGGLRALWYRAANMDLLITMGVVTAFAASVYGTLAKQPEFVHLHAAAMILALVCVGRYLEARAKGRASAAMAALARRAPRSALVMRNGELQSVAVDSIVPGDQVCVPAHAAIPVDGEVTEGTADVDESLMTGEPMPVLRTVGDRASAGTLVTEGKLMIRATSVGSRSSLGRIVEMVRKAQTGHTHMQRIADRIASVFVPIVVAIAAATFVGWLAIGGWAAAAQATRAAVAVLVVACPCALGLATPTAVLVASGLAALRGILVRDAPMLEAAGLVDVIVWDKTGTLTAGRPSVRDVIAVESRLPAEVTRVAAAAEQFSVHPLAKAIVALARRDGIAFGEPTSFGSVPGGGVTAQLDQKQIVVGSPRFLESSGVAMDGVAGILDGSRVEGDTAVVVAVDGRAIGVIFLTDAVRPSSAEAVRRMRSLGVRSEILTGDELSTANSVASAVEIDCVSAGVDPAGKVDRIKALQRSGERVAMVGDGVNDAAALATADVGIAFATGADVASEAAGINLVGSTPQLVADAVALARASVRTIRQNLAWAFLYNGAMIPLAAVGKLPPAWAAGAMMISSLTVVLNSLLLPRRIGWTDGRAGHDRSPPTPTGDPA
ncbi:MAG: heavy metal translocating P-type ATPase [Planctomycetota bacterium]|nr:heavy metal translocating P-type ATPase [Planctomycetota bacterium]